MSYPITFTSHTRSHIQEKHVQGLLCFIIVDFAGFFCLFLIQDCKKKKHSHTQEKQLDCASEKKKIILKDCSFRVQPYHWEITQRCCGLMEFSIVFGSFEAYRTYPLNKKLEMFSLKAQRPVGRESHLLIHSFSSSCYKAIYT